MTHQPRGGHGAARDLNLTPVTYQILHALLAEPGRPLYGQQIIEATGLASGSIYPALHRLQRHGWTTTTEEGDPAQLRRPLRRYYQVTEDGAACARRAVVTEAQRLAALARRLASTPAPPVMPVGTSTGRQPGK